jgi:hypothetical protein
MDTVNRGRPDVVAQLPLTDRRIERLARMELRRDRAPAGGRAWINGKEVGGPDVRFAHLARSYD